MTHAFYQVDVFSAEPFRGNPLAVVCDADGLSEAQMAAFARWTNLSETTFLLAPTDALADYRVRIFTPSGELPFAGHPTLGSCAVWLAQGGRPRQPGCVVQQCGIGRVRVRCPSPSLGETAPPAGAASAGSAAAAAPIRLAFAAPPLQRSGELEAPVLQQIVRALGVLPSDVLATQWLVNGPQWAAVKLDSAERVLALKPDFSAMGTLKLGVVAPCTSGTETAFEVRAFAPGLGVPEDPVTGSLQAGLAQWLIGSGQAPAAYTAAQGTAIGRAGRVHIQREGDDVWVGGDVSLCITGRVQV
jgi:predicted PhzF superfamily epimerase YddE/YHI9